MRIALAEIRQETCSFSTVRTTLDTFRQHRWLEGNAVIAPNDEPSSGIRGFQIAAAEEDADVEPVPILDALAGASGPLTDEILQILKDKLAAGLRQALPVDGLFFSLHGAAAAETEPDVEGALLETARAVVGPDLPIVAPLDHHANITARMMRHLTGLVGHRTQPHDGFDTAYLAAKLLLATVRGRVRPAMAWHKIPMITHQEQFLTSGGPMREWFQMARDFDSRPGVLHVSPFPMQPWLDVPEAGWTSVVVTDGDPQLAAALSEELARKAWELRERFWVYESLPVEEAIRRAVAAPSGLVVLSDTGDSVFGGAPGDSTVILREMLRQEVDQLALVPLVDSRSARAAYEAGPGAALRLALGGDQGADHCLPMAVDAEVAAVAEGFVDADANYKRAFDMGRSALLAIGALRVVVSEYAGVGGNHPIVYRRFGLEPAEAKMAVLKTASNFQHYRPMTAQILRVNTPGPTMSALHQLPWQRIPRPMYPLDPMDHWQP